MPLSLSVTPLAIELGHPFAIARSTSVRVETAIFRLAWRGLVGLGEVAPSERYHESVESVIAHFAASPPEGDDPYRVEELLAGHPPAARCGLDAALHDLIGKDVGRPLWRMLGLDPERTPVTSFTIGLDTVDTMVAKTREAGDHPILKIKLGAGHGIETIEAIRSVYRGTLRIDANEAWEPDEAVRILGELAKFDVEFCEQPIPAGAPERLRYVHERSPIPIVTDEDSREAADLPALRGCTSGVNIKLVKCGGIRGALAMIATARALGLKIMLGCMVESAILTTAAAHLTPLVDWADLDGPFLTRNDPFTGITYDRGKIVLPTAPGLGVSQA